jgi:hypothetical protein
MTAIYCIVECKVTFNNGSVEIKRPTYSEISVGLASVDKISVLNYLRSNLTNVKSIEVIDTLYFATEKDYQDYLRTV